jgi:hypothetical protein
MYTELVGWGISLLIVLYMIYKFWKRILKTLLIASVVFLIVGVVKVKSIYDSVIDTPQKKEIVTDTVTEEVEKQVDKMLK